MGPHWRGRWTGWKLENRRERNDSPLPTSVEDRIMGNTLLSFWLILQRDKKDIGRTRLVGSV